jgi:hypothetical protein
MGGGNVRRAKTNLTVFSERNVRSYWDYGGIEGEFGLVDIR